MKKRNKTSAIVVIYLIVLYCAALLFNHVNAWLGILLALVTVLSAISTIEKQTKNKKKK